MKGRKIKILVFALALTALFAFTVPTDRYFDIAKSLDIFATLVKEVNANYVDEVDPKKLIHTRIIFLKKIWRRSVFKPQESMQALVLLWGSSIIKQ